MADQRNAWNWSFRGYLALSGKKHVQDWFNDLPDEAKDEARDAIAYLQHSAINAWKCVYFDTLEDGISEVRFRVAKVRYRMYGYFGPADFRQSYTFLHGTDKKVSNDKQGKTLAKDRKGEIEHGKAGTHQFEFEEWADSSPSQG